VLEAIEASLDMVAAPLNIDAVRDNGLAVALRRDLHPRFHHGDPIAQVIANINLRVSAASAFCSSRRSEAVVMPLTWPGMMQHRKGRHSASASICIFVVNSALERLSA
jgi:hypothetical protein